MEVAQEQQPFGIFVEWNVRGVEPRCEIMWITADMTINQVLQKCLEMADVGTSNAKLLQNGVRDLTPHGELVCETFLEKHSTVVLEVDKDARWNNPGVLQSSDPWITNKSASDLFVIESLLTPQECKKLIQVSEDAGYDVIDYNSTYCSNSRVQIQNPKFAALLFERIRKFMPDVPGYEVSGLNPQFRFCRYEPGQDFKQHTDGLFDDTLTRKSFFSVNIYLNDNFTGGATRFFDDDADKSKVTRSVQPKTGNALVFDHRRKAYLHDGQEVTSGCKYLLRTDVMYLQKDIWLSEVE